MDNPSSNSQLLSVIFDISSIPPETPQDSQLFVAGSCWGWRADSVPLKRGGGGRYRSEPVFVSVGQQLTFKITRGSWNNVEKASDGGELPNRNVTPRQERSGPMVISVQVARWSDSQQLQMQGVNNKVVKESPQQDRMIRVFISSTFRDMKADRDYLVKFTFPQLHKLCESRGVTWGEVDLRWGVTDEQAAEGKVLPICLEEIQRCRPYFIGILGERYGWVPGSIPQELLEKEPWLSEQVAGHKSVTELEILHGVLRNKQMAGHAFFYFRDPAYAKSTPAEQRAEFLSKDENEAAKLRALKNDIRASGFPVRENFAGPEALGAFVLARPYRRH